jgi:hypothetical protein
MKKNARKHVLGPVAALAVVALFVSSCGGSGERLFGDVCEVHSDCSSGFCVGGEPSNRLIPFCSEDCTGRKTGDSCGDGRGSCIVDFVSWCWVPCETDIECGEVNLERSTCTFISSSGVESPFKVCTGSAK